MSAFCLLCCIFVCTVGVFIANSKKKQRKMSSISTFHMQTQSPTSPTDIDTDIKSKENDSVLPVSNPVIKAMDTSINYGTLDKLGTMYTMQSSTFKNEMELNANAVYSPYGPIAEAEPDIDPSLTLKLVNNALMLSNQNVHDSNSQTTDHEVNQYEKKHKNTGFMRMNWGKQESERALKENEGDVASMSLSYGQYGDSVFDAKSMMLSKVKSMEMLQMNQLFGTNSPLTDDSESSEDQEHNEKPKQIFAENQHMNVNENADRNHTERQQHANNYHQDLYMQYQQHVIRNKNADNQHKSLKYIKPNTVKFMASNVHTMKPLPFYKHNPTKSIGIRAIKPNMVKNAVNKFKQFDESSSSGSESS